MLLVLNISILNSTIKSDKEKKRLYPYLAGLIESDGVLITPKNSSTTPTIYISLHEKERPFAEHLLPWSWFYSIRSQFSKCYTVCYT